MRARGGGSSPLCDSGTVEPLDPGTLGPGRRQNQAALKARPPTHHFGLAGAPPCTSFAKAAKGPATRERTGRPEKLRSGPPRPPGTTSCPELQFWGDRGNTHGSGEVVNHRDGEARVARAAAQGHGQRVPDQGLEAPLAADVHEALAAITANLRQRERENSGTGCLDEPRAPEPQRTR